MAFRESDIDCVVDAAEPGGELPAWVRPRPWYGQTVFTFWVSDPCSELLPPDVDSSFACSDVSGMESPGRETVSSAVLSLNEEDLSADITYMSGAPESILESVESAAVPPGSDAEAAAVHSIPMQPQ